MFRTRTEEYITDFFRHNIGTAVWDTFKCAFRGNAIQYSSIKQKQFRSKESILTKKIEGLTVQLDSNKNGTIEAQDKLEEKQKEMEELIQERSSVIYYNNKANWMEYGEKCTKLFFNLQYINATKLFLLKLVTNDGVTHDSTNDISERGSKVL